MSSTRQFAEIDGKPVSQVAEDFPVWEAVLESTDARLLLELGTGTGTFSRWLAERCQRYGIEFVSFDQWRPAYGGFRHIQTDVLVDPGSVLPWFRHPMILWCDNGNKPSEVAIYAPHLEPGDILAVHDWGDEIGQEDIPDGFEWLAGNDMTRWFTCRSQPAARSTAR